MLLHYLAKFENFTDFDIILNKHIPEDTLSTWFNNEQQLDRLSQDYELTFWSLLDDASN